MSVSPRYCLSVRCPFTLKSAEGPCLQASLKLLRPWLRSQLHAAVVAVGDVGKVGSKAAAPAASPTNFYGSCDFNVNAKAKHQDSIYEDLELIKSQEGLGNIISEAGGSPAQAPFFKAGYAQAMEQVGIYRCGGNALWASLVTGPVTVNQRKLQQLIDFEFSAPAPVFPETVVIGIYPGAPCPLDENSRGLMTRISPEEPLHAWVNAVANRIRESADVDEMTLWANMVKTCSIEFRRIEDKKMSSGAKSKSGRRSGIDSPQ